MESDGVKKAELQKKVVSDIEPQFCRYFQNLLESNNESNKYFLGSSMTLADLAFYEIFTHFLRHNPEALKDYPQLIANRKLTEEHENLKGYLANRPDSNI
ncbi:glutathione S-transferase-like [Argopecten irradians]|uniref:glutathione S-transferase-like n=1 Tax=Argopecten irradians TaxID=31199 RepID=UPI00371ACF7E